MDTAAWYAASVPLYALYVALEVFVARRRGRRAFGFAETISNLTAGLGTLLVGIFVGPWVLAAWNFAHDHVAPFPWPAHGAWKLPAAFVFADFCYYAYHRAGHRFALFWSIHGIHHQHEHLNSSVGFRLEWLADPYAALFFGLMPLAGIDSTTGFSAIALLSVYALLAHSSVLRWPSLGLFVTPAVHGAHHSRDARFTEKNFGAMLAIWDRMFGTWREPAREDVLHADVPSICRTHDGVSAQWGLVRELGRVLRETPLGGWPRVLFRRPVVAGPPAPLRRDDEIAVPARRYVFVHFVLLATLGAWLLLFSKVPLAVAFVLSITIVFGLFSLGGVLDGRPHAPRTEKLRLAATAVTGFVVAPFAFAFGLALVGVACLGLVIAPRWLAR